MVATEGHPARCPQPCWSDTPWGLRREGCGVFLEEGCRREDGSEQRGQNSSGELWGFVGFVEKLYLPSWKLSFPRISPLS